MATIQAAGPFSPSPLSKSGFARIVETNATRIGLHGVDFRSSFLKPVRSSMSCFFGLKWKLKLFKLTELVKKKIFKINWK